MAGSLVKSQNIKPFYVKILSPELHADPSGTMCVAMYVPPEKMVLARQKEVNPGPEVKSPNMLYWRRIPWVI